jgi:hypothetical protein
MYCNYRFVRVLNITMNLKEVSLQMIQLTDGLATAPNPGFASS